ncbi:hypothetical protein H6G56_24815 [Anabaena variabilis FACHB-164]|nr:hypothetical protein [Trichormus variabilis FACHB-164]
MSKIIDSDINVTLVDMTPVQMETLLGGCCQSSQTPFLSNLAEIMNSAKKSSGSADNKYSNQKINSIDNSKKTYVNGILIPSKGNTVVVYG